MRDGCQNTHQGELRTLLMSGRRSSTYRQRILVSVTFLLVSFSLPLSVRAEFSSTSSGRLAIVGGLLIDGNGGDPVQHSVVLVEGNRIVAVGPAREIIIPPDTPIIDASGMTVLPGLINSNCHLTLNPVSSSLQSWEEGLARAEGKLRHRLKVLLMHGVTSIRDTTGYTKPLLAVKPAVDGDEIPAARLFIGGRSVASPERFDSRFLEDVKKDEDKAYFRPIYRVPDDLIPIEGPEYNFWKISLTGGEWWGAENLMSDELLTAIVQEGHRAGKVIDAHVQGIEGIRTGLAAGLDVMQHPNIGEPIPLDLIEEYAASGVFLSPLHSVVERYVEIFENPYILNDPVYKEFLSPEEYAELQVIKEKMLKARARPEDRPDDIPSPIGPPILMSLAEWRTGLQFARENLRNFIRAKTRIVMSTDCSSTPFNFVEMDWHVDELQAYVRHGMSPMEALQAATKNGGELLREDLGMIVPGYLADIIVVKGNPLVDMHALRHVEVVIKNGIRYK